MREQPQHHRLQYKTIKAVVNGDTDAINSILDHYRSYTLELSTKRLHGENGNDYLIVDEYMCRRLETKLITGILTKFKAE